MPLTPAERSLRGQIAVHESWARTEDRTARTAPARKAALDRFEREVDPDGVLTPGERAIRAEHARKAYFKRLALQSAKARRRRRDGGSPPTPTGNSSPGGSTSAENLIRAAHTALNNAGIRMSASKVSRLVRQFQHRVEANGQPFDEFLCNAVVMDAEQRRRVLADPEIARVISYSDLTGEMAVDNAMRAVRRA